MALDRGGTFISHSLQDVFAVAGRIVVRCRGVQTGKRRIADTTQDKVVNLLGGG